MLCAFAIYNACCPGNFTRERSLHQQDRHFVTNDWSPGHRQSTAHAAWACSVTRTWCMRTQSLGRPAMKSPSPRALAFDGKPCWTSRHTQPSLYRWVWIPAHRKADGDREYRCRLVCRECWIPSVRSATVNGKSGSLYPNERSSFRDFRLGWQERSDMDQGGGVAISLIGGLCRRERTRQQHLTSSAARLGLCQARHRPVFLVNVGTCLDMILLLLAPPNG